MNRSNKKNTQQFQVGDLVKLRPDILKIVFQGNSHFSRSWRKTLENLEGRMGKITREEPGVSLVSVEFEQPWIHTDEHGRTSQLNTIGITSDKLVPYAEDPSLETEGFGGGTTKDINADPKHIPGERWRIKFQSDSDLSKHGNTEKSSVKNELRDLGKMPDDKVSVNEIRGTIQELLKEMWIGFEEEKEGKNEGIKDLVKKTWGFIKPPMTPPKSDPTRDFFRHLQSDPKMRKAIKTGAIKRIGDNRENVKEGDNPNKSYIILGKSGPQTIYYCESPTQGNRLVPYSQDVARRFKTREEVHHKIIELKQKYKGITKWDYEVVPAEKSEWEKTYSATVKLGPNTVSTPRKNVEGEWVIKWMINGKRDEGKTHYTDDRKDAINTYTLMIKQAEEENKKSRQS